MCFEKTKLLARVKLFSLLVCKTFFAVSFSFLVLSQATAQTPSNAATLKVTPARCVVFREGQYCDENIQVHWQATRTGSYCIHSDENPLPVECWINSAEGSLVIEKKITKPSRYLLKEKGQENILASDTVTLVWVYEAIRKNRATWRLF